MEKQYKDFEEMDRKQLIAEIKRLEQLVEVKVEGRVLDKKPVSQGRQADREDLSADIEFIFDLDIVEARGLDISDTGIAFEVDEAPPVEMKFRYRGEDHHYRAKLVRTKSLEQGGFLLGMVFTGEVTLQTLPDAPDEDSPSVDL